MLDNIFDTNPIDFTKSKYDIRETLIAYLKEMDDITYQQEHWDQVASSYYVGCILDFFYSETELVSYPTKYMGNIFKNKEEFNAINALVIYLDKLCSEHGDDLSDIDYINTTEWRYVTIYAQKALHVFLKSSS